MKITYLILMLIVLLVASCRISDPGNTHVNEAMLIIENYSGTTLYIKVDDGNFGPIIEHTLLDGQTYSQTWESDDEVFVLNNGQVLLTYHDGSGDEETAIIQLSEGNTSYYTISDENSILLIRNQTSSEAWFRINDGNTEYLSVGQLESIAFGDLTFPVQVNLFYTGYHVFSNTTELTVYPFNTQEFEIVPDAGAIKLENNSLSDIVDVYIAPVDDQYWGGNVLDLILEPAESAFWTVEPGWWDVRIVDEWGASFDFLNNYVALDGTDILTFRSSTNEINQISTTTKLFEIDPQSSGSNFKVEYKNISN